MMTRGNFFAAGLVILLLAIGANTVIVLSASSSASSSETRTCEIQNRGLKAGPHLTAIIRDIGVLLTPLPGTKQSSIPPSLVEPLANLREEAGAYVAIEHEQPPGRNC